MTLDSYSALSSIRRQGTILARTKDMNGNVQPGKHDPNFGSYVINYSLQIEVFVVSAEGRP